MFNVPQALLCPPEQRDKTPANETEAREREREREREYEA